MTLDYPSILLCFVLINIFNIILYAYQYFFHHKKWDLLVFTIGILVQTIGMVMIAMRKSLPFFYTVQLSNLFLISSFSITTFGIISFDGKKRKNLRLIFIIFTILFYSSFLLVAKNDIIRIVIQIIACSFFYGIAAISLFTNQKKYQFSIIISVSLFIYAVFQLTRAYIIFNIDQPYNFMAGSPIDSTYLAVSLFVVSTLRIGYIMLLKEIDQKTILLYNTRIQQDKIKLEKINATKDKFFSIIAHDLRSPFNGIIGFSRLLIENIENFEIHKSKQYLDIINTSAQNTLVLLDNLLIWAKTHTGQIDFHPQKINLSLLIHEVIALSKSYAIAKEISLVEGKTDVIDAYADEDMSKTILRNLISNAIKFTKTGGNISISTKKEQNQIIITVSDNGVGMNKETIDKLFLLETNITTIGTAKEKGSGLGLILCKELVEKQGGKIWVDSEIGKGSTFKFTVSSIERKESA